MTAFLAFFAGPLGRWIGIGLLMLACAAFGWFRGNAHGTQKLYDYQAGQLKEAVRIAGVREKVTTKVVTEYVKVAAKTQTITETVQKEVVRYVESNPGYCLDAAWGRLHDAAATNTVPSAASGADGPERAPTAAGALEAVTESYAACHRTADRLDGLQAWVRAQQAVK